MPKYAQLVMGPAGSGKSTYCAMLADHLKVIKRDCYVVNLDPAAENFKYPVSVDCRELIQLDDVMEDEELHLGPNGGLLYCMEYIINNLEWLQENLEANDDDYFLFDCPGQIELYTHLSLMRQLTNTLQSWDFRVCGVFLVDSQFLGESNKFISGILSSLSCMINLEISHVSVMTKLDLLPKQSKKKVEEFLDPDVMELTEGIESSKYQKLTQAICQIIEDYGMVRFLPLDISEEESIDELLQHIDMTLQYGEDLEVEPQDFDAEPPADDK